jgi:hypothetical protein
MARQAGMNNDFLAMALIRYEAERAKTKSGAKAVTKAAAQKAATAAAS